MNRLVFKFYKSYFDIANELDDNDRLAFYDALLNKQFLGIEPNLKGMPKFAYISQKHSIDLQVKGLEYRMKITLNNSTSIPPAIGSCLPPIEPPKQPPLIQEEVKEEVKEKLIYRKFNHLSITFVEFEDLKNEFNDFSEKEILDCFDKIENYKQNTKYKSLYLTSKQWLKKQRNDNLEKLNSNGQITGKQQFRFSTKEAIKTITGNN